MDKVRIAKLIRLLASDVDGEVLAAARALRKCVNLNDLGNVVEFGEKPKPKPRSVTDDISDDELVEYCFAYIDRLGEREYDFVEGMPGRLEQYGKFTPAQRKWLVDIYKRLSGQF